jgi:hypothetical protein
VGLLPSEYDPLLQSWMAGRSRREFLGLAGTAAIGIVGSSLFAGCSGTLRSTNQTLAPSSGEPYYFRPRQSVSNDTITADVVIYGATVAGLAAAIQVRRMGMTAVVVEPSPHVGGMTTGGLSATDVGSSSAIGGFASEFYSEVGVRYGKSAGYQFEPHVASEVLQSFIERAGAPLYLEEHPVGAVRSGDGLQLKALHMDSGRTFTGGCFIDASYEGDVMAFAGVTSTVGREANSTYRESMNGVQLNSRHTAFESCIAPGPDANSLWPTVFASGAGTPGAPSTAVQAYCFRLTVVRSTKGVPFPQPTNLDTAPYELMLRDIQGTGKSPLVFQVPLPRQKFDLNNGGPVSIDLVGVGAAWAEASFPEREQIFQQHVQYQRGLIWFLANDSRVPAHIRHSTQSLSLALGEFQTTGGWPSQLYIREARRMVSDVVLTERDVLHPLAQPTSVGCGSYLVDSHVCSRVVVRGCVANEGVLSTPVPARYSIPYGAILPRRSECGNLLVPVCLSATHVAWSSLRTEPVFMILGQSAGAAAVLAIRAGVRVQDIDSSRLRPTLLAARQVLDLA